MKNITAPPSQNYSVAPLMECIHKTKRTELKRNDFDLEHYLTSCDACDGAKDGSQMQ